MSRCSREDRLVEGLVATVDFFGVQKQVNLHIVDEPVVVGDYILNHVGYAIRKIPLEDVEGTVAMYQELIDGKPDDLMRQDIEGELRRAALRKRGQAAFSRGLEVSAERKSSRSPFSTEGRLEHRRAQVPRPRARPRARGEAGLVWRQIGRDPVAVMHVCGSHEQAIARFGLRAPSPARSTW